MASASRQRVERALDVLHAQNGNANEAFLGAAGDIVDALVSRIRQLEEERDRAEAAKAEETKKRRSAEKRAANAVRECSQLRERLRGASQPVERPPAKPIAPAKSPKLRKSFDEYFLGDPVGQGVMGQVHKAVHISSQRECAVKIMRKDVLAESPSLFPLVQREIAILQALDHPHIVHYLDIVEDDQRYGVVCEYAPRGELYEYIAETESGLPEDDARRLFVQLLAALRSMHHHSVCHRDLKPENILLDADRNIRVADLGLAIATHEGDKLEHVCGSPHYAAPEIVKRKPYDGCAADMWSAGVVLFVLLTAEMPFDDDDNKKLLALVAAGRYTIPEHVSIGARDLLERLLVREPSERATAAAALEHPWLADAAALAAITAPHEPLPRARKTPRADVLDDLAIMGLDADRARKELAEGSDTAASRLYALRLEARRRLGPAASIPA